MFPIDGGDLELLVAQDGQGLLALADSYVAARQPAAEGGWAYSRVKLEGEVPTGASVYTVRGWGRWGVGWGGMGQGGMGWGGMGWGGAGWGGVGWGGVGQGGVG